MLAFNGEKVKTALTNRINIIMNKCVIKIGQDE